MMLRLALFVGGIVILKEITPGRLLTVQPFRRFAALVMWGIVLDLAIEVYLSGYF